MRGQCLASFRMSATSGGPKIRISAPATVASSRGVSNCRAQCRQHCWKAMASEIPKPSEHLKHRFVHGIACIGFGGGMKRRPEATEHASQLDSKTEAWAGHCPCRLARREVCVRRLSTMTRSNSGQPYAAADAARETAWGPDLGLCRHAHSSWMPRQGTPDC